jgi:hypothetical protein
LSNGKMTNGWIVLVYMCYVSAYVVIVLCIRDVDHGLDFARVDDVSMALRFGMWIVICP